MDGETQVTGSETLEPLSPPAAHAAGEELHAEAVTVEKPVELSAELPAEAVTLSSEVTVTESATLDSQEQAAETAGDPVSDTASDQSTINTVTEEANVPLTDQTGEAGPVESDSDFIETAAASFASRYGLAHNEPEKQINAMAELLGVAPGATPQETASAIYDLVGR